MTSFGQRSKMYRRWWKSKTEGRTIFCASVENGFVKPQHVIHLYSAVFDPGIRTYAFETEQERDDFVRMFPGVAEPCEDPAK